MIALAKVLIILSAGATMGYWLANIMMNCSEQSRKEEKLFREEMSSDRKYEELFKEDMPSDKKYEEH